MKTSSLNQFKKFEVKNLESVVGGAIICLTGVLDGIKKNTRLCFFCKCGNQ
ncbi:hypothetical protein SAMN04487891_113104 [Flagellimonas taeanensis]|uniref:Uncharacterized protein n=2 Tax=Flagellimonas TaxID=444459 RepID=A0A1M6UKQ1_9FLAO|nr:hypothetical protein [[Muricauda] okinawensis]MDF0708091.1 hypothetical protein [[Muricauda] okinawensis]SFC55256.1 hypothetical protein SAMN04487891_113104 [Allomuricauda taeanensis]SHK69757.1 hypothetical protein SAMN05216293_1662 [Allomuricauda taeanensis]